MRTTALLLAVILLGIMAADRHRRVPYLLGRLLSHKRHTGRS
jgi:hypothetical protein